MNNEIIEEKYREWVTIQIIQVNAHDMTRVLALQECRRVVWNDGSDLEFEVGERRTRLVWVRTEHVRFEDEV